MKAKTVEEYLEIRAAENEYSRAAARWVANFNRSPAPGVTVHPFKDRTRINPLCEEGNITGVTFGTVGGYAYSEMTWAPDSLGLEYTFWEDRVVSKGCFRGERRMYPVEMWLVFEGEVSAGKLVEECVKLL